MVTWAVNVVKKTIKSYVLQEASKAIKNEWQRRSSDDKPEQAQATKAVNHGIFAEATKVSNSAFSGGRSMNPQGGHPICYWAWVK